MFNIRFIAINDVIDSFKNPTSTNTILVPFKNLLNDEYARDTSLKIKSALTGRKKRGEFVGAFASYGYMKSKDDNHKLIVDKEASEIVKKIFEWKVNEGLGNLLICHKLNEMGVLNPTGYKMKKLNQNYNNSKMKPEDYSWCPSTVRNILKNDVYIGNITQGKRRVKSYKIHKVEQVPKEEWITVENMHEPIISKELFEKAQALNKVDTRVQNDGILNMWSGILRCIDCGRSMNKKCCKNKIGRVYEYYICGTYRKKSNKLCTKHTLKSEELENAVLETIKIMIEKFMNFEELINKINKFEYKSKSKDIDRIRNLKEKEIEKLSTLKKGLYEDWKNDYITKEEYLDYKKKYDFDIEKTKEVIFNLRKQTEKQEMLKIDNNEWMQKFKEYRNITSLDRNIIMELIDKIEVCENKKIIIYFKFSDKLKSS